MKDGYWYWCATCEVGEFTFRDSCWVCGKPAQKLTGTSVIAAFYPLVVPSRRDAFPARFSVLGPSR